MPDTFIHPSMTDKRLVKMINKILKSSFGAGILIFAAAAIIALPVRTLQFFTVLESGTGFFSQNDWSVYLLYAVLAAAVLAVFVFGFIRRKKLAYSLDAVKRPGFGILSLTAAAGAVINALQSFSFLDGEEIITREGKLNPTILILAAQAAFAALSAIYFLALGLSCMKGSAAASKLRILSLSPVIWSIFRLVHRFTHTISYIRVSDLMLEMLMIAAFILFFMAFAQCNSQVNGKGIEWKIGSYGLTAALLALVCFVPRFIVTLTGNTHLLSTYSAVEYCDFALALFAISAVATRITDKAPEAENEETAPENVSAEE